MFLFGQYYIFVTIYHDNNKLFIQTTIEVEVLE